MCAWSWVVWSMTAVMAASSARVVWALVAPSGPVAPWGAPGGWA
jgi:hypothetical protein